MTLLVLLIAIVVGWVTFASSQEQVALPPNIAVGIALSAGVGGAFTLASAYKGAAKNGHRVSPLGVTIIVVSALAFVLSFFIFEGTRFQLLSVAYAMVLAGASMYGFVRG